MGLKCAEMATGELAAGVGAGDASLTLSSGGSKFSTLGAGDYMYLRLCDKALSKWEIMKCAAHTVGSNSFTSLTRNVRSSTGAAQAWNAGDLVGQVMPGVAFENLGFSGRKNVLPDGMMQIAQGAAASLSTSYAFGKVDMWACKGTTTVGAGTMTQAADNDFKSGFCLHLSGITLSGGSEAVFIRGRIESKDVQRLIATNGCVRVKIKHDIGSAKTATVTINKADSADNFSSVTQIAQTTSSIPGSTATDVKIEGEALGSCGNGLEIIVYLATGAITTKNIYIGDVQLEEGMVCSEPEVPDFMDALRRVQRHFAKTFPYATAPAQNLDTLAGALVTNFASSNDQYVFATWNLPVEMRAAPTVTTYNPYIADNGFCLYSGADGAAQDEVNASSSRVIIRGSTGSLQNQFCLIQATADARL